MQVRTDSFEIIMDLLYVARLAFLSQVILSARLSMVLVTEAPWCKGFRDKVSNGSSLEPTAA